MTQLDITSLVCNRLSGSLARRWVPPVATLEHRGSTVYLVGCGIFVKIGRARRLKSRVALLQIGNPQELRLLACYYSCSPIQDERNLHQRLKRYWNRGEWFAIPHFVMRDLLAEFARADMGNVTLDGEQHLKTLALFIH